MNTVTRNEISIKKKHGYNNSVRFRIIGITVSITIAIVCVAWIISRFMIEDFYLINAKKTLVDTYYSCNDFVLYASVLTGVCVYMWVPVCAIMPHQAQPE